MAGVWPVWGAGLAGSGRLVWLSLAELVWSGLEWLHWLEGEGCEGQSRDLGAVGRGAQGSRPAGAHQVWAEDRIGSDRGVPEQRSGSEKQWLETVELVLPPPASLGGFICFPGRSPPTPKGRSHRDLETQVPGLGPGQSA